MRTTATSSDRPERGRTRGDGPAGTSPARSAFATPPGAERERYLRGGCDFIDDEAIEALLRLPPPEPARVRDVLQKSLARQRLDPPECAALLAIRDEGLWQEVFAAAAAVKDRVYGPRVVTFAPLYCGNWCLNSCLYCGFRIENRSQRRRLLTMDEIRAEAEALIRLGHKRLVMVYGEHPRSDVGYICESIAAVYDTKVERGEIRRVNVNAAPQSIAGCRRLAGAGLGTYQVFQETYHHATYARVHPRGPKSDYQWRLYSQHRAQDGGIDDVAIGALFGLYDWRFEVLGLLQHAIDLERAFDGVGPHTISFPRLEPADDAPLTGLENPWRVDDEDFLRLIAVLRLAVPYTGLIVTAREPAAVRRRALQLGCTQTDAGTRIGIGAYSGDDAGQDLEGQQFLISDTRSLEEVVREMAAADQLVSFCTSGYRCERTGKRFMDLARSGKVRDFCLPNAILTLKEYLVDYADEETRAACEPLLERRLAELHPRLQPKLREWLRRIEQGERDLRY